MVDMFDLEIGAFVAVPASQLVTGVDIGRNGSDSCVLTTIDSQSGRIVATDTLGTVQICVNIPTGPPQVYRRETVLRSEAVRVVASALADDWWSQLRLECELGADLGGFDVERYTVGSMARQALHCLRALKFAEAYGWAWSVICNRDGLESVAGGLMWMDVNDHRKRCVRRMSMGADTVDDVQAGWVSNLRNCARAVQLAMGTDVIETIESMLESGFPIYCAESFATTGSEKMYRRQAERFAESVRTSKKPHCERIHSMFALLSRGSFNAAAGSARHIIRDLGGDPPDPDAIDYTADGLQCVPQGSKDVELHSEVGWLVQLHPDVAARVRADPDFTEPVDMKSYTTAEIEELEAQAMSRLRPRP